MENSVSIQLIDLSKTYALKDNDVHAAKDVSLSFFAGEIFGIIGSSGAGKSTLLRCINFLETPSSGKVLYEGVDLSTLKANELRKIRRNIGMISQNFNLLKQRTVFKNVCLPFEIDRFCAFSKLEAHARALKLIELVGLSDKIKAYPRELSGGQQQRVAIARALALKPKVLICDEATSALDPVTTDSILKLLKEINQKFGITIILITHQLEVVEKVCGRVAVMDDGHVAELGTVSEVFSSPKSEAAKRLLLNYTAEFRAKMSSYLRLNNITLEEEK